MPQRHQGHPAKLLTKEDYFREQAKTEKKLDQILNLLMKGRLSDE